MYIPIWLIIIGVVIYFIYQNNHNKQINQSTEEVDNLPELTNFSLRIHHEQEVNTLNIENAQEILNKHLTKTSQLADEPNKVKSEREKLDKELKLSQRMWQFIDDIKYYPSWRKNQKNDDGSPWWRSKAITPEQLLLKEYGSSELKQLIDKPDKFKDSDEILEYSFNVENEKYIFFANKSFLREDEYFSSNSELIYYYPVYIFLNDKLIFQTELYYESDGNLDYYHRCYLEAFKPGKWTIDILNTMFNIRQEEESYSKELREKMDKEREEKNKKNFIN